MNYLTAEKKITYDLINFDIIVTASKVTNLKGKQDMPVKAISFFIPATLNGHLVAPDVKSKLQSKLSEMGFQRGAEAIIKVKVNSMYSNNEKRYIGEFMFRLSKNTLKIEE